MFGVLLAVALPVWAADCEDALLLAKQVEQAARVDDREAYGPLRERALQALGCEALAPQETRGALARLWNAEAARMIYASEDALIASLYHTAAWRLDPDAWTPDYPQKIVEQRESAVAEAQAWAPVVLKIERAPPPGTLRVDGALVEAAVEVQPGPHLVQIGWPGYPAEAVWVVEVPPMVLDWTEPNPLPPTWDEHPPLGLRVDSQRAQRAARRADKQEAQAAEAALRAQEREDQRALRAETQAAEGAPRGLVAVGPLVSVGGGVAVASEAIAGSYGVTGKWAPSEGFIAGAPRAELGGAAALGMGLRLEVALGYQGLYGGDTRGHLALGSLGVLYDLGGLQLGASSQLAMVPSLSTSGAIDVDQYMSMCLAEGTPEATCALVASNPENLQGVEWTGSGYMPGISGITRYRLPVEVGRLSLYAEVQGGAYFSPYRNYPWGTLGVTLAP